MSIYRPRSQRRVLLAVLVLASITVITLDFRSSGGFFGGARETLGSIISPVRRGSNALISPVTTFFSGLVSAGDYRAEAETLRDENAALRARIDELNRAQADAEALRHLASLPLPPSIQTVTARVGPSDDQFEWTMEIDRGSSSGIAEGMPVVAGNGLVGRVEVVWPGTAIVRLIHDPNGFGVGARLEHSDVVGTITGKGGGPLEFEFLANSRAHVEPGERVFTLGGSTSSFPANIPIGIVAGDLPPPAESGQRRILPVVPDVDRGRLNFVKVLLYSGERVSR